MALPRSLFLLLVGFASYPLATSVGPSVVRAAVGGPSGGVGFDASFGGLPVAGVLRGDPAAALALLRRLAPRSSGLLDDDPAPVLGARRPDRVDAIVTQVPRRYPDESEAQSLTRHLTALSAIEVEALENVIPFARSLSGDDRPPPSAR